jgi:hypothetical protein
MVVEISFGGLLVAALLIGSSIEAAHSIKLSIFNVEGSFLFGAVAERKGCFQQEGLQPEFNLKSR